MTAMTSTQTPPAASLHTPVIGWFEQHARDLPWRRPEAGAWGVMVSEFMLQQTPVSRVLPVYEQWLARWPRPADLAAEAPGRRSAPGAARLPAPCAAPARGRAGDNGTARRRCAERARPAAGAARDRRVHGGGRGLVRVRTAARGARHERPPGVRPCRVRGPVPAERDHGRRAQARAGAAAEEDERAARWAAATMELGALVCTARNEDCDRCPIASRCAWRLAGKPAHQGPPRKGQTYAGTDRQVRGRLLAVLRDSVSPVAQAALDAVWEGRCSGPVRWTGWWPTGWSSRWPTAGTGCR